MGFHITRQDLDDIAFILEKANASSLVIQQLVHKDKTYFLGFDPNKQEHFIRGINNLKFDTPTR